MKIPQVLVKNKATIALGLAMVGVIATAVCATKEAGKQTELENEKKKEINPEKPEEAEIPITDEAIILVKSHWKTGMAVATTFGLMILSHKFVVKELAAALGALAVVGAKKDEIEDYFQKNFPDEYKKFKETVTKENIKKVFQDKPQYKKEETYDGRMRLYDDWSKQKFYATEAQALEAECAINEKIFNTGSATLFDYLATFPASSGVKLYDWMKYIGWYEGCDKDGNETCYCYNCSFFGNYIKPDLCKETIVLDGEELEVTAIIFNHCLDFDPELTDSELSNCEKEMKIA